MYPEVRGNMTNHNKVEAKCMTQHRIPRNEIITPSLKARGKMGSALSEAILIKRTREGR